MSKFPRREAHFDNTRVCGHRSRWGGATIYNYIWPELDSWPWCFVTSSVFPTGSQVQCLPCSGRGVPDCYELNLDKLGKLTRNYDYGGGGRLVCHSGGVEVGTPPHRNSLVTVRWEWVWFSPHNQWWWWWSTPQSMFRVGGSGAFCSPCERLIVSARTSGKATLPTTSGGPNVCLRPCGRELYFSQTIHCGGGRKIPNNHDVNPISFNPEVVISKP